MARLSYRRSLDWYKGNRSKYEDLCDVISSSVEGMLRASGIQFVAVNSRAKSVESFREKIKRKRYKEPKTEMTDLAGIRIITLTENDITQVEECLRSTFNVHENLSNDKSLQLEEDRFGYRSVHYVFDIGAERDDLPEFTQFKGILFEIQIRTALQHAWAEIEHDRNYKYSGELPREYKRRLSLIAGLLEIADREFNLLTEDLDGYAELTKRELSEGDLVKELNSTTIKEFISQELSKQEDFPHVEIDLVRKAVVDELRNYGIENLEMLSRILSEEFLNAYRESFREENDPGTTASFLRLAMMYDNFEKYFTDAWNENWTIFDFKLAEFVKTKYDSAVVHSVLNGCNIFIEAKSS